MPSPLSTDIADFSRRDLSFGGVTKPVLTIGSTGPAVIVIHEIFGFTPPLARFCRWVRDAGMRVYAPVLLGSPNASNPSTISLGRMARLCVSREFTLLRTNRSSPIVDWLKPLAHLAHQECGGPGVGVIGMCLTGGFALSMAVDPVVLAPVLSQPGLPITDKPGIDISPADMARVRERGLPVRGYRFEGDALSDGRKFDTLRRELGAQFTGIELPDACGNPAGMRSVGKPPHSVMTGDLIDTDGEPTKAAADEVIGFFRERLGV